MPNPAGYLPKYPTGYPAGGSEDPPSIFFIFFEYVTFFAVFNVIFLRFSFPFFGQRSSSNNLLKLNYGRESKLTRLIKTYFTGFGKASLVVCMSQVSKFVSKVFHIDFP